MESDRRLNRWGLTFTPAVINRLRKVAIYGQPQLSLEHQGRAKRYVVRGVESGGATEEVGYYVTFAGESGGALTWLQTDLQHWTKQFQARESKALSGLLHQLPAWQQAAAFAAVRDLEAGITYINAPTIGAEVHLPFGGTKATGNGHREGGIGAIDFYTEWKSVYIDYSDTLQKAQIDRPE